MSLYSDEARAFLAKPKIARMAVVDSNGFPHVVPVWFMLDGDDIVVFGERGTRKVAMIKANPKGSVSIGGEPGVDDAGYLIKGEWTLEEDPSHAWTEKITRHYEPQEEAEKHIEEWTKTLDLLVMRLKPVRVIKAM